MDAASLSLVHRLIAMGTNSLLQYVGQSNPWAPGEAEEARNQVLALVLEERPQVAHAIRLLQEKRLRIPVTGSFPARFTTINFVSLDYLLPRLCTEVQDFIAEIEPKLRGIEDAEVLVLANAYLDMKRRHLETLRGLQPHREQAAVA